MMKKTVVYAGGFCLFCIVMIIFCQPVSAAAECKSTPYDEMGPFYRPNAPVRSKVGAGYLLEGTVRSEGECRPLPGAKIEFWLVNEDGVYDDAHRATVIAGDDGGYSFESNRPTDYVGRLPHIHIRVTAEGYEELVTQHYPQKGENRAEFDLVLEKAAD
jgi:protocatechuate 3,4-dioxygenase beta subunit